MTVLNHALRQSTAYESAAIPDLFADTLDQIRARYYHPDTNTFGYQQFAASNEFTRYMPVARALSQFHPESLSNRESRIAFWLNVYNMMVIHAVAEYNLTTRITDKKDFFSVIQYTVGEHVLSLDDIEHGILRGNNKKYLGFKPAFSKTDTRNRLIIDIPDPRVHCALYSACRSSSPWRVYRAESLEAQLRQATSDVLQRYLKIGAGGASLQIPKFFQWYESDFGDRARVIRLISDYYPDTSQLVVALDNPGRVEFSFLDFNWTLNKH